MCLLLTRALLWITLYCMLYLYTKIMRTKLLFLWLNLLGFNLARQHCPRLTSSYCWSYLDLQECGDLWTIVIVCFLSNVPCDVTWSCNSASWSVCVSILKNKCVCVWFQLHPQLDVLACVKEAVQAQKLVLTTPWVVKYLSMIDPVSAHLPYYRAVFEQLFHLYRDLQLSGRASFLIRLLLGWLFESSDFLEGLFYSWRQDLSNNKLSVPGLSLFPAFRWF
jgi:hypothetical protein